MNSIDPKILVVYYSSTGSVFRLAEAVAAGAEKAGAEVRVRRVAELAPEGVIAADADWTAQQLIDTTGGLWFAGELQNKVYASFTATSTAHGGVEATILALNNTFYHWGGFIVPPGYTDEIQHRQGNPYGASHVAGDGRMPGDVELLSAEHMGHRLTTVAAGTAALRAA